MNVTRWIAIMVSVLLGLALVGAQLPVTGAPARDTFNFGNITKVASLDPHRITSGWDHYLLAYVYDGLVGRKRGTTEIEPRLAVSWRVSPNAKVYTLKLRPNVKFHDGSDLNAEAVRYSIDRVRHFRVGAGWVLDDLERFEIVDPTMVRFTLKVPNALFLSWLEHLYIVSPAHVKKHEKQPNDYAADYYADNANGTGPYRVTQRIPGDRVFLEKFDAYWGGWQAKHFRRIIQWEVGEATTQRLMLERGELDAIRLFSSDDIRAMRRNQNLVVNETSSTNQYYIRLNMATGPTTDVRVRKALAHAFDFKLFFQVEDGFGPSDGPCVSEFMDGWKPNGLIGEANMTRARELLREAGVQPFRMSFLYPTGIEWQRRAAEIWQSNLRQLGITLDIRTQTWPTMFAKLVAWKDTRDPATMENSYGQLWGVRYADTHAYLNFMYRSDAIGGAGRNMMYYTNPEVDRMIDQATWVTSTKARVETYKRVCQLITDEAPDIFVGRMMTRLPMRTDVKGFYFDRLDFRIPFNHMWRE